MTVAARVSIVGYVENGDSTSFAVPFRYGGASNLIVERLLPDGGTVPLAHGTDFTSSDAPTDAGGTLTLTLAGRAGYVSGSALRIRRSTLRQQTAQYPVNDRFPAALTENALDTAMMVAQETADAIDDIGTYAIQVPRTAAGRLALAGLTPQLGPNGGIVWVTGTGADGALRVDLARPSGSALVGLKRAEAGTRVEVLADYARRIVYPESWGVVGDGLTDDQPTMQAMVDSLDGGETIEIGVMNIRLNSAVRQNKTLTWRGRAKERASRIWLASPTADGFYVYDDATGTTFEKLEFLPAAGNSRSGGAYINIQRANRVTVRDFTMQFHALGIVAGQSVKIDIINGFFWQCRPRALVPFSSSIQLGDSGYTGSVTIDKCLASNQQSPDVYSDAVQPFAWLDLINADIVNVNDCSPQMQGMGIVVRPGRAQFVTYLTVKGGVLDTSRQALVVKPGGGWTSHCSFLGVTFAVSNLVAAVTLNGTDDYIEPPTGNAIPTFNTISDYTFDGGCRVINNTQATTGVLVKGPHVDGIQFSGYYGNNGDSTGHGIDIDLQSGTNIYVIDPVFGARGPTIASENIGLNVAVGVTGGYRGIRSAGIPSGGILQNHSSSFLAV